MTGDGTGGTVTLDRDAQSHSGRPGNYYVGRGTWIRSRVGRRQIGVIREVTSTRDRERVSIEWYPDAAELVHVSLFVDRLRDGRYEVLGSNEEEMPVIVPPELEEKRWGTNA